MSRYLLELNKEPPIKTYNHHAFGTGIITTIEEGKNWIYNNYILLSYYPKDGLLSFDFYMDYIYCQPVFDRESFSDETMRCVKWNPVKLFVDAINRRKYVICCVDEYYIPNREAYRQYHFKHNIIIFGYDDVAKVFYTAGYDDEEKYSFHKITYKQLRQASPSKVNILKFRTESDYELSITYIDRQIKQYNGDAFLEPVGSYPKEGRLVGIAAVNAMLDDVCKNIKEGEPIDIRPINILWEHRKLMRERLQKLESLGIISKEIAEEFDIQVQNCERLRNRTFLYNRRQSEKDGASLMELQKKLRDVKIPMILDSIK